MPHIHKEIDFTVAAFIVHQDKVLLIDHKQLKKWLPVGGHIELDEDTELALFREIREETRINKDQLEVLSIKPRIISEGTKFLYTPNYQDIHVISPTHRHIGLTYFLRSATDRILLAEGEHHQIRWFLEDDLSLPEYNISEAVKFYAKEALKVSRSSFKDWDEELTG